MYKVIPRDQSQVDFLDGAVESRRQGELFPGVGVRELWR